MPKDETRQEPAKAADLQQEPAIPKGTVFPAGSVKPAPALPENAEAKKPAAKKPKKATAKKVEKATAPTADVETRTKK